MPLSLPATYRPTSIIVHSFSWESPLGRSTRGFSTTTTTGTAWTTANKIIYVPIVLNETVTAVKTFLDNGGTVNGNCDVGIYDDAGNKIVSKGSTANAGASDLQEFDITDTVLAAGRYYLAMWSSSTTAAFRQVVGLVPKAASHGVFTETNASGLVATATFAVADAITAIPLFGFSQRTLVA